MIALAPTVMFAAVILVIAAIMVASHLNAKKRRESISEFANQLGLVSQPNLSSSDQSLFDQFKLANRGRSRKSSNVIVADSGELRMVVFDYQYTTGSGKNSSTHSQSVVLAGAPGLQTPPFQLSPEGFFHRIAEFFGYNDIDFDDDPTFSKMFLLHSPDEAEVREFMGADRRQQLCKTPMAQLESIGSSFIFFRSGKQVQVEQVTELMNETFEIYQVLKGDGGTDEL